MSPFSYDPMTELGFIQDRVVVSELEGIFVHENILRKACEHFIPNGQKVYDVLDRYSGIVSLAYEEEEKRGITIYLAPIFAAYGVSDYDIYNFVQKNLKLAPGAIKCANYINSSMPFFINTGLFETAAYQACEKLEINDQQINQSIFQFDDHKISREAFRDFRREVENISRLEIKSSSKISMLLSDLDQNDLLIHNIISDIFTSRVSPEILNLMAENLAVDISSKSYRVLDLRRELQIDLDKFMYIGSGYSDCLIMDHIKSAGGIQIQVNAESMTLAASNVQIVGADCSALAILQSTFFETGPEGVKEIADNWSNRIDSGEIPDIQMKEQYTNIDSRIRPSVYLMENNQNADLISYNSEKYRKELEYFGGNKDIFDLKR